MQKGGEDRMKARPIRRRALLVAVCLTVLVHAGASVATQVFTAGSLKGRWSVQLGPATSFGSSVLGNPAGVNAAARQHVMRIGYIMWDGLGGATGRFLTTTDTNSGLTMTIDYQWSGTYVVNSNGTGTLTVTTIASAPAPACLPDPPLEGGVCTDYVAPSPLSPVPAYVGPETFAFAITAGKQAITLIQRSDLGGSKILLAGEAVLQFRSGKTYFFTTAALKNRWSFQLTPATGFAAIAPGDPGGVALKPRQNVLRVGVIQFDGFGMAVGHTTATTEDNTGQTVTIDFDWLGPYTMNSDGTGTLNMNPASISDANCTPALTPGVCGTFEGPEVYAFVVSKLTKRLLLDQLNNSGGAKIFMRGSALQQ